MSPTNTLFLSLIAADTLQPAIVDQVSDTLTYVGYCASTCTSYTDAQWFIKRISTDDDGQKIFYSNGSRKMNVAWTDRYTLNYAPTETWSVEEEQTENENEPD